MTRLYPLLPWALCVLGAVCCLSGCDGMSWTDAYFAAKLLIAGAFFLFAFVVWFVLWLSERRR